MDDSPLVVELEPEGEAAPRPARRSGVGRWAFYLSLFPTLGVCLDTLFHPG